MIDFDKVEIKNNLTLDDIFQLLVEFGGEPEYTDFGIISATICHNEPNSGASRKLYYYEGSGLFHCYTSCENPSFDIYDLVIKVHKIQKQLDIDLNDAVRFIAYRFGIFVEKENSNLEKMEDWKIFKNYDIIKEIDIKDYKINLPIYDDRILKHFNYNVKITPWLKDNISQEAINLAKISYYPGGDQIVIPHFDINGKLVGIRGRTLVKEDAERFGKYRPLKIFKNYYSHPLGVNLYGLNWAKDNIKKMKKAIILESEKAVLQYISYFGIENDIAVACCGSNLSVYQIELLQECGAQEIVIGFDRQFEDLNSDEATKWIRKLKSIGNKYKNYVLVSVIFDKNKITSYKASPTDEGKDKFLQLFKERIVLY